MSVESIAIALHHSRATGTAKLVLLGIANHDGDGGAWPAKSTLAKYAGFGGKPENNRARLRKILRELEDLGEILTEQQGGGTRNTHDWERPNLYTFTLACPPDCDRTSRHRTGG